MDHELPDVVAAEFVVPAGELRSTIDFFVKRLGFRVDAISPADSPVTAALSGHGVRVRLDPACAAPGRLRLRLRVGEDGLPGAEQAPNGTIVEFVDDDTPMVMPPADDLLVITRRPDEDPSGVGRAGMLYRDLIPERHGGRFIASHISIPEGGPVPDYVHFHKIRFQMIFCRRGWVRVAYEDQGDPILMHAGDCVLQPPLIRHRVLEASPGLEVVEIASPAVHQTLADHTLALPTGRLQPDRDFGGQRFVHHVSASAPWDAWSTPGFERQDLQLERATFGLARVAMLRTAGPAEPIALGHDHEFAFWFVLDGSVTLVVDGRAPERLVESDSCTLPAGLDAQFVAASSDLCLLEVVVPR